MSKYLQRLYNSATDVDKTDETFFAHLEKTLKPRSVEFTKTISKNMRIMLEVNNTTLESVIEGLKEIDSTDDVYIEMIVTLIQDYIDFIFDTRPCPRCYYTVETKMRGKRCVGCDNTRVVNGISAQSIPMYVSVCKKMLRYYGILKGISNEELKDKIHMPTIEEEIPEALTKPLIQAILNQQTNLKRKLYWWSVAGMGLRGGEGVQLTPEDFEFINKNQEVVLDGEPYWRIRVKIRSETTKKSRTRYTFVPKETQKDIAKLIKKTQSGTPLFSNVGTDVESARGRENEHFEYVCERLARQDPEKYGCLIQKKKSGNRKYTFHSLRSYAVTILNRIDYGFGHALAGHKQYMSMYDRLTNEQLEDMLEKSDDMLAIFSHSKNDNTMIRYHESKALQYEKIISSLEGRIVKLESELGND